MVVIYAEKKSVASSIAAALGAGAFNKTKDLTKKKLGILGHWKFTWNREETYLIYGVGHLTELQEAKRYGSEYSEWNLRTFPCLPEKFVTIPVEATIDYFRQALKLFRRADLIISATDSDREGQVVFDYLYRSIGCKVPWKRAWLPSDLTPPKIRHAFEHLEEWSVRYPLTLAGIARSVADWEIGINLTVAATLKYGGKTLLNVGRVQTTVLNMVAERTREIEKFKPTPFWKVALEVEAKDRNLFAAYLNDPDKFFVKAEALAAFGRVSRCAYITVTEKKTTRRRVKKPLLYSTSQLQIEANKKYGYAVTDIAKAMEELYSSHYITYPRTEAVVLSNAQEKEASEIIAKLFRTIYREYNRPEEEWSDFTKRHFDDALIAKSGDSHTAVIPTTEIPNLSQLTEIQKNIYEVVAKSLICLAYDDAEVEDTTLELEVSGYKFKAKGTTVLNYGSSWFSVFKDKTDTHLPCVDVNDRYRFKPFLSEGETKPKPYYTQATLLKAMMLVNNIVDDEDVSAFMKATECGLGTGGTRPEIIGGLIRNKLLEVKSKRLVPTEKGYWLIDHLPQELQMIKNPLMTGRWEQMLSKIASSDLETSRRLTGQFLAKIREASKKYFEIIAKSDTDLYTSSQSGQKFIGAGYSCPKCGKPLHKFEWGFGCTGYKDGCKFALGQYRGKKLTERQMTDLLEKGKTGTITFTKEDGGTYKGILSLDANGNIVFGFATRRNR